MAFKKMTPEERLAASEKRSAETIARNAAKAEFRNDPVTMKYANWKFGDPVESDAPDEIRAQWWAAHKAMQAAALNK